MHIIPAHNLACPLDGERLLRRENQLVCTHGHTYDVARQGYVNLLPVQHKRTKQPGDSKAMVAARSRFLHSGLYAPVANALAEITYSQLPANEDICVMEAGCGEGYYLDTCFDYLKDKEGDSNLSFIGLDISKHAIVAAAKRNAHISWIVGTNRQPPVDDSSVDIILCVFGYQNYEAFYRKLKPTGKLVLAEPGPSHLKELREIIYNGIKKPDTGGKMHVQEPWFSLTATWPLQFSAEITGQENIANLFLMTPHYFRTSHAGREAVAGLQALNVTIDIVFKILEKTK